MFPSSGYFRGVNCPFFASGLCDRVYCHFRHSKPQEEKPKETLPSYSTQTGPSYSFNSSQISGYSASPYLQKGASGYIDNYNSSKETPPQSNLLESYTTSDKDESPVSIPSFTESSSVLPESAPEPQIDRQSLPKISGLAKRKSYAAPSYNPTPKDQISSIQSKSYDSDIPSYHPTPKNSLVKSKSKSGSKSVIKYDPEKNYAVNQKEYSSSDEEKGTKQSHSFPDATAEAEFSEDEEETEENSTENNLTHSPVPNYAEFLTPSSYFTSKLSNLSSNAIPGGEKNDNRKLSTDSESSSTSHENGVNNKKSDAKSRHHSSSSKSSSKTKDILSHRGTSSSKSTTNDKTKSSSHKHSSSSAKSSSSEDKVKSLSNKGSSSSAKSSSSENKVKSLSDKGSSSSAKSSSSENKVKSLSDKSSSSSVKSSSSENKVKSLSEKSSSSSVKSSSSENNVKSLSDKSSSSSVNSSSSENNVKSLSDKGSSSSAKSSSSENKVKSLSDKGSSSSTKSSSSQSKVKSSSPRESSSLSKLQKDTKSHTSSTHTCQESSPSLHSTSKLEKTHCNGYSSKLGSKSSTPESVRKSDHCNTSSNSKLSHSKPKGKESHPDSNHRKHQSSSKHAHSSSSSSKHSGAEEVNDSEKPEFKFSHSTSSIHSSKEFKRSSSDSFHEKLNKEESNSKKISRSFSANVEIKKSQNRINDVKEERRHSSENKKDLQVKSHSLSDKERNREKNKTVPNDNDRRRSLDQRIKNVEKSGKRKKVTERRISDITSDLFGEGSDGSDSDVQIIEPPPQPPPEILELTDSDEDFTGSGLLKEDDFDFSDTNTFDECLRIFQETDKKLKLSRKTSIKTEPNKEPEPSIASEAEKVIPGKKRMAHSSAQQVIRPFKASQQNKPRLSPAEVMHNRIVEMQKRALFRAAKREGREADLPGTVKSKSAVTNSTAGSSSGRGLSSDLVSAASLMSGQKKRDAHLPSTPTKAVSNVNSKNIWSPNSFYSKKNPQVDGRQEQPKSNMVTISGTASKVEKRKAHVPTSLNLTRPLIPAGNSSKVPVNVRQRYLNSIIDEFLKFCQEETAFQKGQQEEQEVYNRATNKNIYLRVAVNAIKRIRTEAAMSQPSSSKKAKLTLSSLASHGSSTVTQSHEATLGGSLAAKTSFTLNRSGAIRSAAPINFKGLELYNRLKKHILSEDQLRENGYPRPSEDGKNKAQFYTSVVQDLLMKDNERLCRRCGKRYFVAEDGTPVIEQECIYHYSNIYKKKVAGSFDSRYGCCNEKTGVKGCQVSSSHVNEKNKYDNLTGYMKTLPAPESDPKNTKVFSLDCEMVYTKGGLELARVTVIGDDKQVVYETLVKPDTDILDYNTRFSGIRAIDMKGVVTTLRGVQAVLLSMVSDKTILMGHSLESDFTALKLIHSTVVDTALVFPHRLGLPFKRALRNLALDYLQKIIQADDSGHDSKEDALSCMELVIYKVKEEAKSEEYVLYRDPEKNPPHKAGPTL